MDILLTARIFPRPCGARKDTTQLKKSLCVLYVKPSNKMYLLVVLFVMFITYLDQEFWLQAEIGQGIKNSHSKLSVLKKKLTVQKVKNEHFQQ